MTAEQYDTAARTSASQRCAQSLCQLSRYTHRCRSVTTATRSTLGAQHARWPAGPARSATTDISQDVQGGRSYSAFWRITKPTASCTNALPIRERATRRVGRQERYTELTVAGAGGAGGLLIMHAGRGGGWMDARKLLVDSPSRRCCWRQLTRGDRGGITAGDRAAALLTAVMQIVHASYFTRLRRCRRPPGQGAPPVAQQYRPCVAAWMAAPHRLTHGAAQGLSSGASMQGARRRALMMAVTLGLEAGSDFRCAGAGAVLRVCGLMRQRRTMK